MKILAMPGAHVPLEPRALENGRLILRSAMEYGFVGPLDIPSDYFHPELQSSAEIIRKAREEGALDFSDIVLRLIQTTTPGEWQDLQRSNLSEIGQSVPHRPEALEPSARIVREYYQVKTRVHAGWKLQRILEAGENPAELLRVIGDNEANRIDCIPAKPFEFVRAGCLEGTGEPMDFVEGLLTEGGASVIYGPSNCGKSFWIVDLGAAIATGSPFRDELVIDPGAVVYVALEGAHGARNRIEALKQQGRLKPSSPFFLIFEPVSLLERGHSARLAETIRLIGDEAGIPVKLVILDTMARAMAGGDENSGVDMTSAVGSIDAVRAATGAHVAVVHHCGKDEARGARGHSSLRAAVDTEIEVFRPEGDVISTVRVTKQRDMPIGEPMPFSLKTIELGIDRRGKPITSCIVHHEDEMMATTRSKGGRKPTIHRDKLLSLLPQSSTSGWQKLADSEHGVSKSSFYRMFEELKAAGVVISDGKGGWNHAKP